MGLSKSTKIRNLHEMTNCVSGKRNLSKKTEEFCLNSIKPNNTADFNDF